MTARHNTRDLWPHCGTRCTLEGTRERTRDGVDAIASQAERLVVSLLAADNYATL